MSAPHCIFCRIARGDVAAEVVYTSPRALAFLDARPLADGHLLVVPRTHVARVEDLEAADAEDLFRTVVMLAGAVRRALDAEGHSIGINDGQVAGQTVPHVHIHIVPRRPGDGAGSVHTIFRPGPRRPLAEVASTVRREIPGAVSRP